MTVWDEICALIDARDIAGLGARLAVLDDAGRREVARELPGHLKLVRRERNLWEGQGDWAEPMRVAGAGSLGGAAAVAAWLNRRDLVLFPWDAPGDTEALIKVISAREPQWQADLVARLALRIRDGDSPGAPLVMTLLRRSGVTPPQHDPLVAAWLGVHPERLPLREDPLLDVLLPRIFEAQGVGRALLDERSSPLSETSWLGVLAAQRRGQGVARDAAGRLRQPLPARGRRPGPEVLRPAARAARTFPRRGGVPCPRLPAAAAGRARTGGRAVAQAPAPAGPPRPGRRDRGSGGPAVPRRGRAGAGRAHLAGPGRTAGAGESRRARPGPGSALGHGRTPYRNGPCVSRSSTPGISARSARRRCARRSPRSRPTWAGGWPGGRGRGRTGGGAGGLHPAGTHRTGAAGPFPALPASVAGFERRMVPTWQSVESWLASFARFAAEDREALRVALGRRTRHAPTVYGKDRWYSVSGLVHGDGRGAGLSGSRTRGRRIGREGGARIQERALDRGGGRGHGDAGGSSESSAGRFRPRRRGVFSGRS